MEVIYTTSWGERFYITTDYKKRYRFYGDKVIDDYNIANFEMHKANCGYYIVNAEDRRAEDNEYTLDELYNYIENNLPKVENV